MPHKSSVIPSAAAMVLLLPCAVLGQQSPALAATLDRASRQVTTFLEKMSDVKCTEEVTQLKLTRNGHPEYSESGTYDYLIMLQGGSDDFLLNESRLALNHQRKHTQTRPLLITNGFSTLFLIFHPYYVHSFRFEIAPDAALGGRQMQRVKFTHIPGTRTPAALAVRGREYPLELTGTAWIDPETGMIARIETTLANDMSDIGLRTLSAQVEYAPMKLPGWREAYFPELATVDVETLRQRWRNVHHFTNYMRFMVDTQESASTKAENK